VVRVAEPRGRTLGFAFHSTDSEIRLRVFERGERLEPDFLTRRLDAALAWREVVAAGAEACRLVHAEGDGLPSLIVDRYADVLVIQTLSQATERFKDQIVTALVERLAPVGILERNDPRVRELEGLARVVGVVHGEVPDTVRIREGEAVLDVSPREGQKTGAFLDQRENRLALGHYARGRVLDAFCYDGGFALQAARVARSVLAVDVSGSALERVAANARASGLGNVETREANVFDVLHELDAAGERFDTVVLDPPAFAKSRPSVARARRGYKEINLRALRLLPPGGVLVTCSCSYHVDEVAFEEILQSAARDAGAGVVVVEKRRQARDHPVLLGVPETHYLKCFVLRRIQ
jgi:23S rRNA (cytosine1962-C5)-methyltransferase